MRDRSNATAGLRRSVDRATTEAGSSTVNGERTECPGSSSATGTLSTEKPYRLISVANTAQSKSANTAPGGRKSARTSPLTAKIGAAPKWVVAERPSGNAEARASLQAWAFDAITGTAIALLS